MAHRAGPHREPHPWRRGPAAPRVAVHRTFPGHRTPVAGVAHPDRIAPVLHPVEQLLASGLAELLGVAYSVDSAISGQHDSRDRERTGPGTSSDLVQTDHDLRAVVPELPFEPQGRTRSTLCHGGDPTRTRWPPRPYGIDETSPFNDRGENLGPRQRPGRDNCERTVKRERNRTEDTCARRDSVAQ